MARSYISNGEQNEERSSASLQLRMSWTFLSPSAQAPPRRVATHKSSRPSCSRQTVRSIRQRTAAKSRERRTCGAEHLRGRVVRFQLQFRTTSKAIEWPRSTACPVVSGVPCLGLPQDVGRNHTCEMRLRRPTFQAFGTL